MLYIFRNSFYISKDNLFEFVEGLTCPLWITFKMSSETEAFEVVSLIHKELQGLNNLGAPNHDGIIEKKNYSIFIKVFFQEILP